MGSEDDETAVVVQLAQSLAIVLLGLRKGPQIPERDRSYEITIFMDVLKLSKRVCESSYLDME